MPPPRFTRCYFPDRSLTACPDWLVRWLLSSNLRQMRFGEAVRLASEIYSEHGVLGMLARVSRCYMSGGKELLLDCDSPEAPRATSREEMTRAD